MSTSRPSSPIAEVGTGAVSVTIHYAEDLPHPGGLGRRDTYCLLSMGGKCLRTRTAVDGGCNPMWHETLSALLTAEDTIEILIKDDDPASQQPDIGTCSISIAQALRARGRTCGGRPQRLTMPVMAPCAAGSGAGAGAGAGAGSDRVGAEGAGGVRRGYLAVTVAWEPCCAQFDAAGPVQEAVAAGAAGGAHTAAASVAEAGAAWLPSAHHTLLQPALHATVTEVEGTAADAQSAAVQEAEAADVQLQGGPLGAQRAPSWARQRSRERYPQIFPYAYPPWPPAEGDLPSSGTHGSAPSAQGDEAHDGPVPLRQGPGPAAAGTLRHLRASSSRRGAAQRARDALRVGLWKRVGGGGGEGEASGCLLVRARTA